MASEGESDFRPITGARVYLVGSIVVFALVLGYLGCTFFSRWQLDRAIEERVARQKRVQAQQTFEGMGGNHFDILSFYADPRVMQPGHSVHLCYSVSNAKSVTLEPQSNAVWPSYERCVSVSPNKTITYTLTATDATGHTKSATATVEVR
jgi:hypothetical protein